MLETIIGGILLAEILKEFILKCKYISLFTNAEYYQSIIQNKDIQLFAENPSFFCLILKERLIFIAFITTIVVLFSPFIPILENSAFENILKNKSFYLLFSLEFMFFVYILLLVLTPIISLFFFIIFFFFIIIGIILNNKGQISTLSSSWLILTENVTTFLFSEIPFFTLFSLILLSFIPHYSIIKFFSKIKTEKVLKYYTKIIIKITYDYKNFNKLRILFSLLMIIALIFDILHKEVKGGHLINFENFLSIFIKLLPILAFLMFIIIIFDIKNLQKEEKFPVSLKITLVFLDTTIVLEIFKSIIFKFNS